MSISSQSWSATATVVARPSSSAGKAGLPATAQRPLRLGALTALVVGSMVGSGIFSLPQNMASAAGAGAIVLGWLVTGAGMLALALVYQSLALRQPGLNNGVYAYARASGGDLVGFGSAWGYWMSAWIGNASYLVIFFAALATFFPQFGEGNNAAAIAGASVLLWALHGLTLAGVRSATFANTLTTLAKLVPLLLFVGFVAAAFHVDTFTSGFWGSAKSGSVFEQVKGTMLITVWVFIGIEGASVYSGRAARRSDVGRATLLGFVAVLALLMAVSLLSLGVMAQDELAGLKNPSMAGVLEKAVGPWGARLISVGLLVSVGGALLAWILLAAETLFTPAQDGLMPQALSRENAKGSPTAALWVTNGLTQLLLLVTLWSNATYLALILLATSMILVPYLFTGLHALRSAWTGTGYDGEVQGRSRDLAIAGVASVYCVWLLYAAGPAYLLLSALLYAPGLAVFAWARRDRGLKLFSATEGIAAAVLLAAAAVAAYMLVTGTLSL
ncbi:arginine-ornithine antiporter [Caldimonas sp. KR1-144]|uniref:arginine-ornithine antiporter n=1 Tax=Caldimonas sp. KR1-144 TaxID=3400911 RepID=UPI003C0213B8